MQKVLFLMSHLGSKSNQLHEILKSHPRIDGYETGNIYENYQDIEELQKLPHKLNNVSAVYMDHILYNHHFISKSLCKHCNFIFLIREPRGSLNEIIKLGYTENNALLYYSFRLHGLYKYFLRSRGNSLFFTFDNINLDSIPLFLELEELIVGEIKETPFENNISQKVLKDADTVYSRYIKLFNR